MPIRLVLLGATGLLMLLSLGLVFLWVPSDLVLGVSQRIFYLHVPIAFIGLGGFGVVALGSAGYLWLDSARWDALAYTAAEVGAVFCTLILVTGMLWAKPVWDVWWTWSPQLTTSLILWLIYVAYLMLRAYAPAGVQAARYAAVLGIIGFIDVPVIYMASQWWRDVHELRVVGPLAEPGALESPMLATFLVSLVAFTLLFAYLLSERYALRRQQQALDSVSQRYG